MDSLTSSIPGTVTSTSQDEHLVIPAGGMHKTEKNLLHRNAILLTAGSREVDGKRGRGTGFLVEGRADFLSEGPELDMIKRRFPWARAALKISVTCVTQTL